MSICALRDGWKNHHGKEVLFGATYSEETAQEKLLDPDCPNIRVAVEWPQHIPASMKKSLSKLDALIARDSHKRARVVVRGVLFGPVPFSERDIPSNLPTEMKEQMRHGHRGYGYMGSYDYLLKVREIEEAEGSPVRKSPSGSQ